MTDFARALAVLFTAAAISSSSLSGCAMQGADLMPCALNPANAAQFTCGDTSYTILDDTVPQEAVGSWVGRLQVNAAVDAQGAIVAQQGIADTLAFDADELAQAADAAVGIVSFTNVYEPADAAPHGENPAPALIVDVNGARHRAIPTALAPADRAFDPAAEASAASNAPSSFTVDPGNATRLSADNGAIYQIIDQPVAETDLGNLLGVIAVSVAYDADSLHPLSKSELAAIDWNADNPDVVRIARFYGEVRALKDADPSQSVTVEVDGAFYEARASEPV